MNPRSLPGELTINYHGYDYELVEIVDQCWFADDLQTSTFQMVMQFQQNGIGRISRSLGALLPVIISLGGITMVQQE